MFESIARFFQSNIFFFELLFAYIPFIPFFKPKKLVWLRLTICFAACLCFSYFSPHFLRDVPRAAGAVYTIVWYLVLAALTIISIKICFKGSIWNALFCGIGAYAVQHIFFRIKFSYEYLYRSLEWSFTWLNYLSYWLCMAAVIVFSYFAFTNKLRKDKNFKTNNKKLIVVSFSVIVVAVVLSHVVSMYTRNYRDLVPAMFVSITLFSIVCCLLMLDNLCSNVYNKKLEEEVLIIESLWKNDRRQYELSKQNIDLLNMKYHDLKYQLGAILGSNESHENKDSLKEAIRCLNVYDAMLKTGNETLDVVLTEKRLQCEPLGIQLACIADGKLLNKMNAVDIYSLFGNALDNAIDCLKNVEDIEKRLINVLIRKINGIAKIQIENYVPNPPLIVNGFPQTTKEDKQNHGFGLKSIDYIIKKYNGVIQFSIDENMFMLEIVLPL